MVKHEVLANGVMVVQMLAPDGTVEAVVRLLKPTFPSLFLAHLYAYEADAEELSGASREPSSSPPRPASGPSQPPRHPRELAFPIQRDQVAAR